MKLGEKCSTTCKGNNIEGWAGEKAQWAIKYATEAHLSTWKDVLCSLVLSLTDVENFPQVLCKGIDDNGKFYMCYSLQ